ncbi:MAG: lipid-binding SYLF domain-containing protein [Gammaproteobacteria bacterium]
MMRLKIALISAILALSSGMARADSTLDRRIDAATEVLQQLTRIPEQSIPPNLLSNAYAVAVVPNLIKAGFLIGGSFGKGILAVRHPDGRWSNPSFITMGGGSLGWQAGAQATDIILVFKSRKGVDNIERGKLTLGADANVAAGPVGRHTSAATDVSLKAEIYSYSRNRGLFAGVSLEGEWLGMDHKSNLAYYDAGQNAASQILSDPHIPTPARARRFVDILTAKTPSVRTGINGGRTAAVIDSTPRTADGGARTYAIDAAPTGGDTIF